MSKHKKQTWLDYQEWLYMKRWHKELQRNIVPPYLWVTLGIQPIN